MPGSFKILIFFDSVFVVFPRLVLITSLIVFLYSTCLLNIDYHWTWDRPQNPIWYTFSFLTFRSFNYSKYDVFSPVSFALAREDSWYSCFCHVFKKHCVLETLRHDCLCIPKFCNSFYLTQFLKYFMKLRNNYKHILSHCISIKDCWGQICLFTRVIILVSMCMKIHMMDAYRCMGI